MSEAERRAQVRQTVETVETPAEKQGFPLRSADGRAWYESYFGVDYPLLYPEKDEASGEADVRSIAAALAIAPPARVLDAGCGTGRHTMALARRGFRVTGIDRSSGLLGFAAQRRDELGLEMELCPYDLRELPLAEERFDAAICMFTTFGLFSDPENEKVARGLSDSLAPGGRLLLDLANREVVEKAHGTRTWSPREEGYVLDEFFFDPDARRLHGSRTLIHRGDERHYPFDHRVYSEQEIRALLRKVGLTVTAVYGSLDRTPFGPRSPRMVVVAEKA